MIVKEYMDPPEKMDPPCGFRGFSIFTPTPSTHHQASSVNETSKKVEESTNLNTKPISEFMYVFY